MKVGCVIMAGGKSSRMGTDKALLEVNGKKFIEQLMVTFFLFPAEYNILEVAPDYSYSVVGGGSPNYLWVLSRTPSLPKATMDGIFARLRDRGYDLSDIIFVEQ